MRLLSNVLILCVCCLHWIVGDLAGNEGAVCCASFRIFLMDKRSGAVMWFSGGG